MTWVKRIALGVAVIAALGAGYWYLIHANQQKAERIGQLEAQQDRLVQDLRDSESAADGVRTQMELWRWLYDDLQVGYKEVQDQRAKADVEITALREQQDVQDYFECRMPDSLYDWVREN